MKQPRKMVNSLRLRPWLLGLALASAACAPVPVANPAHSSNTSITTSPDKRSLPSDEANPNTEVVETPDIEQDETSMPYRAFTEPPRHVMPPATQANDLPKGKSCRQVSSSVYDHERKRLIAALDVEMRRSGGFVLPLRSTMGLNLTSHTIGSEFRGPKGERLMIVGTYNQCSVPPPFVLNADYEIFSTYAKAVGMKSRVITACRGDCRGCGMKAPDILAIAEVPEGSRVGQPRETTVPIETALVFKVKEMCIPRP